jgi:2-methylcitrate dehydratase PrpD
MLAEHLVAITTNPKGAVNNLPSFCPVKMILSSIFAAFTRLLNQKSTLGSPILSAASPVEGAWHRYVRTLCLGQKHPGGAMVSSASEAGLTFQLAQRAHAHCFDAIPQDVRELAKHCILDFVGLMLVGAKEQLILILTEEALSQGGKAEASAVACQTRLPVSWAATINSAAGHVLAYDDVNMVIPGHGTAVAWPAVLALGERDGHSGRDVIAAYVAGFETVAAIGALVEPSHYDRGFHASATIGTFGAAAAAGHLMGFDVERLAQAISLAGSMAAGSKGVFGTALKPFQVSRAAGNGVLAAGLARRGLGGRANIVEASQGFLATQTAVTSAQYMPSALDGFYLRATLFKYHAACYLAHSPIECARTLRARPNWDECNVAKVVVRGNPMCGKVCNIQEPCTGPEIGYSIRTLVAMALLGRDTGRPDSLDPGVLNDPALIALRDKVSVGFDESLAETASAITAVMQDGREFNASEDVGLPVTDRATQSARLREKFKTLVGPLLGPDRTGRLMNDVLALDTLSSVAPIAELLRVGIAATSKPGLSKP